MLLTDDDILSEYVVYYYKNNGLMQNILHKKSFRSENELKEFLKSPNNYTQIDDVYVKGKRVIFKLNTTVEIKEYEL